MNVVWARTGSPRQKIISKRAIERTPPPLPHSSSYCGVMPQLFPTLLSDYREILLTHYPSSPLRGYRNKYTSEYTRWNRRIVVGLEKDEGREIGISKPTQCCVSEKFFTLRWAKSGQSSVASLPYDCGHDYFDSSKRRACGDVVDH